MSLATLTAPFGDFEEWENEFSTPTPQPYNPDDMLAGAPCRQHRPARKTAKARAIETSEREAF